MSYFASYTRALTSQNALAAAMTVGIISWLVSPGNMLNRLPIIKDLDLFPQTGIKF
jgi:hypothetical protein